MPARGDQITHIFWYQTEEQPCELREILECACYGNYTSSRTKSHLVYFEFPDKLRQIDNYAFSGTRLSVNSTVLNENLAVVMVGAFASAFDLQKDAVGELKIPGSLEVLWHYSFSSFPSTTVTALQFGDANNPSKLTYISGQEFEGEYRHDNVAPAFFLNTDIALGTIRFYGRSISQESAFIKFLLDDEFDSRNHPLVAFRNNPTQFYFHASGIDTTYEGLRQL